MSPRILSEKDGYTLACPHCNRGGKVYKRTEPNREDGHPFVCTECMEPFDDPIEREKKSKGHVTDGLPSSLDADAKELIRELGDYDDEEAEA